MAGLDRGYAIPIISVTDIEPVSLDELRHHHSTFTPPQSYIVLNNFRELLRVLLEQSHATTPTPTGRAILDRGASAKPRRSRTCSRTPTGISWPVAD
jgi:hypothetical protein